MTSLTASYWRSVRPQLTLENAKSAFIGYLVLVRVFRLARHVWGTGVVDSVKELWGSIVQVR